MDRFYVVGGVQRATAEWRKEWTFFKEARIVEITPDREEVEPVLRYTSPKEARPDKTPSIVFKSGTLVDGRLWVCTQTEVMVYDVPSFRREAYLSLPCFNDLHHVRPAGENAVWIANTGLDMVVRASFDGEVEYHSAVGEDPWARFDRDEDYRKVHTTKPHQAHPNHVFLLDGRPWVTRFEQRDAIELGGDGRLDIGVERPHDGFVSERSVYFTTVDGHLVEFDRETHAKRRTLDLNLLGEPPSERPLGWCRGLHVLDDRWAVVGFTRLRQTRFRQNLRWVKRRASGEDDLQDPLPTRIALYDLEAEKHVWDASVESGGLSCVFSIHPAG